MRPHAITLLLLAILAASCARSKAREYELRGQVLGVDRERGEVLVKHDEVKGLMPAMTMPFKVRDPKLLDGRTPGDLIMATLVIQGGDAYLSRLEKTGSAPPDLPPPGPTTSGFELLKPGELVPDTRFVSQDGKPARFSDWRGRAVALTFIYTRCPVPTFCPVMDRQFVELQRRLRAKPDLAARAHLVSVSFDPAYDTPAVLRAHAKKLGADPALWTFLTGDRDDVDRFAMRLGVTLTRDTGTWEIGHTLRTAVLDPEGRLVKVYTGFDWTPEDILKDLGDMLGGHV